MLKPASLICAPFLIVIALLALNGPPSSGQEKAKPNTSNKAAKKAPKYKRDAKITILSIPTIWIDGIAAPTAPLVTENDVDIRAETTQEGGVDAERVWIEIYPRAEAPDLSTAPHPTNTGNAYLQTYANNKGYWNRNSVTATSSAGGGTEYTIIVWAGYHDTTTGVWTYVPVKHEFSAVTYP